MKIKKQEAILNDIKSALDTIRTIVDPKMRLAMLEAMLGAFGAFLPPEAIALIEQAKLEAINEALKVGKTLKSEQFSADPLSRPQIGGIFEALALNMLDGINSLSPEKKQEIANNYSNFISDTTETGMMNTTNLIDKLISGNLDKDAAFGPEKAIKGITSELREIPPESKPFDSAKKLSETTREAKREIIGKAKAGKAIKHSELPEETKENIDRISKLSEKAENLINTKNKMSVMEEIASLRKSLGDDENMSFSAKHFKSKKESMVEAVNRKGNGSGLGIINK